MIDDSPDIDIEEIEALEDELPLNDVFAALSDRYVRYTIYYLHDGPNSIGLDRLADIVAAWDATFSSTIATRKDRDRVRVILHRIALPKLDSLDYLTYEGLDTHGASITEPDVPAPVLSHTGGRRLTLETDEFVTRSAQRR